MGQHIPDQSASDFPWAAVVVLFGGLALLLGALMANQPQRVAAPSSAPAEAVAAAVTETATAEVVAATEVATAAAEPVEVAQVSYDPAMVSRGESLFMSACSACHGMNARGIPGVGKDLLASEFFASLSDIEAHDFLVVGRQPGDPLNTTGMLMPPKGGNPMLTDEDLYNIIAYLRVNADAPQAAAGSAEAPADAVAEAPAAAATESEFVLPIDAMGFNDAPAEETAAAEATESDFVLPIDAMGFNDEPAEETAAAEATESDFVLPIDALGFNNTPAPTEVAAAGGEVNAAKVYAIACSGCHAPRGEGIPGVTRPLAESALLSDDEVMLDFLLTGDTELELPYPHPTVIDAEARALVAYLHALTES